MICPKCGSEALRVLDTRKSPAIDSRVRMCKVCCFSFKTEERPVLIALDTEEVEEYERYIAKSATQDKE